MAIEYDGAQHWKKKDRKRDKLLIEKYHLPVLRIKNLVPKEKVINEIREFIEENIETKPKRKWEYEKNLF